MKEIKINLLGEELTIAFNMAVEIAYEQIADEPFGQHSLESTKNSVILYYASIAANNPDTKITLDRFLRETKATDLKKVREAVLEAFADWCDEPVVIKEKETPQTDEPQGKN